MILFYAEEITPRIEYIARLIFSRILQVKITFTSNSEEFLNSTAPKINYSGKKFSDELYIKPNGLLNSQHVFPLSIKPFQADNETYFFESSEDSTFLFDPFAASFYIVTRYEEYLETKFDKYDRYSSFRSILHKNGLLKKPVINIWAKKIMKAVQEKYPDFQFPEKKFKFISTIDIDNAWAIKNKGVWRSNAAIIKAILKLNFLEVKKRRAVLSDKEKDPYDTYEYIDSVVKKNTDKVKFFFLLGDYSKYDKNISFKNASYRELIQKISQKYDIGIHPSYQTGNKNGVKKTIKELKRLQKISGVQITKSRQHFLRLKFPNTYRQLLNAGILEDYTMGYADQSGFRAGICTPFNFYDLEKETTTNLVVLPFQTMDVTLKSYMKLSPAEALKEIEMLMMEVKQVNGTFVSIWHNETITNSGTWEGYREVFEKMNQLGFKLANE
ncbi:MAG: polysaccharide deacetylase family protein [Prolixibacteraceae bacterium]|nr:polysaccharide deacetylase family protein [Prolixibacteraceae bacterium]